MSEKTNLTATNRQIYLTRRSPHYWRITLDHPPLEHFWSGHHSTIERGHYSA